MRHLIALILLAVWVPSMTLAQNIVTAISVPVGGSVHVTIYDVYSDGSTKPVSPANSTWTSTGPLEIGDIEPDSTGWVFTGLAVGTTIPTATDLVNNVLGPPLTITVTPAGTAPTITKLQYTSP